MNNLTVAEYSEKLSFFQRFIMQHKMRMPTDDEVAFLQNRLINENFNFYEFLNEIKSNSKIR